MITTKPASLPELSSLHVQETVITPAEAEAARLLHDEFSKLDITLISEPEQAAGEIISAMPELSPHENILRKLAAELGQEVLKHPAAQAGQLFTLHLWSMDTENALPIVGNGLTRLVVLPVGGMTSLRGNLMPHDIATFCNDWAQTMSHDLLMFTAYPSFLQELQLIDPDQERQLLSEHQLRRLQVIQSKMRAEAQAASMQSLEAQTALIGMLGHLHRMGAQLGNYFQSAKNPKADDLDRKAAILQTNHALRKESRALAASLKKDAMNAMLSPQLRETLRAGLKELRATGILSEKHAPKIIATPRLKISPATPLAKPVSSATIISFNKATLSGMKAPDGGAAIIAANYKPSVVAAQTERRTSELITSSPLTVSQTTPAQGKPTATTTPTKAEKPTAAITLKARTADKPIVTSTLQTQEKTQGTSRRELRATTAQATQQTAHKPQAADPAKPAPSQAQREIKTHTPADNRPFSATGQSQQPAVLASPNPDIPAAASRPSVKNQQTNTHAGDARHSFVAKASDTAQREIKTHTPADNRPSSAMGQSQQPAVLASPNPDIPAAASRPSVKNQQTNTHAGDARHSFVAKASDATKGAETRTVVESVVRSQPAQSSNSQGAVKEIVKKFETAAKGACAGCGGGNCAACTRGNLNSAQANAIKTALKAKYG